MENNNDLSTKQYKVTSFYCGIHKEWHNVTSPDFYNCLFNPFAHSSFILNEEQPKHIISIETINSINSSLNVCASSDLSIMITELKQIYNLTDDEFLPIYNKWLALKSGLQV